jgi:hypothetical protein
MRTILALGMTSVLVATTYAQVVLGNDKGKVRAVNALAPIETFQKPLQWSRRNFQDGANTEIFGFYPAYTIQVDRQLFDALGNGENVGFGGATTPVTITTVDSLVKRNLRLALRASPFPSTCSVKAVRTQIAPTTATTALKGQCGLSTNWTTATRTAGMW